MDNEVFSQIAEEFPKPKPWGENGEHEIDLRAFALGKTPQNAREGVNEFIGEWEELNLSAWWKKWWNLAKDIGEKHIAPLLKAPPEQCVMVPSVSHVLHQLLSSPELRQTNRRKIICTDQEFRTIYDVIQNINHGFSGYENSLKEVIEGTLAMKLESQSDSTNLDLEEMSRVIEQSILNQMRFNLEEIPSAKNKFDVEAIINAIDHETALVVIPHVASFSGELFPEDGIKRIVEKADKCGARVVVDGSQAIGSIEIDVEKTNPHIYTGTLLKQGCGGPGNGYLYIRHDQNIDPTLGGWVGKQNPFNHEDQSQRAQPSTDLRQRFYGVGTPAIAPLYHAPHGLRIFESIGYPEMVRDITAKSAYIRKQLADAGLPLILPINHPHHSALIALQIEQAAQFKDDLEENHGVFVAGQDDRVRAAPHIYTSVEDVQRGTGAIIQQFNS